MSPSPEHTPAHRAPPPKAQVEAEECDTVGTERDLPISRTHLFTSEIRVFAEGHTMTLGANIVAREFLTGSPLYGRQRDRGMPDTWRFSELISKRQHWDELPGHSR